MTREQLAGIRGGIISRRIVNRAIRPREIALPDFGPRYYRNVRQALPLPETLVVGKEECLVFSDGAAKGPAELVLNEVRQAPGGRGIIKEIARVQGGVSQELKRLTVEIVRA